MNLAASLLEHTLPDRPYVDAARILAIVTAGGIVAMLAYLALHRRVPTEDRLWAVGVAAYALFVAVQEGDQVGHVFVWWRLPTLLVGNIFVLLAMTTRASQGEPWWKRRGTRDYSDPSDPGHAN